MRTTYRSGIGALLDNNGDIVTDDKAKAELFNEYFASVGTVDNGVQPVCTDSVNCIKSLDTVEFSTPDVAIVMTKLKSSTSGGPDGLPPILFKKLVARLAEVLCIAFTQLMSVGTVPQKWKAAIITPVFTKVSAGAVANYLPISLTCVPCKIMERLISCRMLQFFLDNSLISYTPPNTDWKLYWPTFIPHVHQ